MSLGLHIELEEIEQTIVLRLDGRLDAATSSILERKLNSLIDEQHFRLALDFAGVDYLSSAGMRVLLSASKKLYNKQGALVLFSVSSDVEEIFKMAGFDRILSIFSTEKEALQVFHKK